MSITLYSIHLPDLHTIISFTSGKRDKFVMANWTGQWSQLLPRCPVKYAFFFLPQRGIVIGQIRNRSDLGNIQVKGTNLKVPFVHLHLSGEGAPLVDTTRRCLMVERLKLPWNSTKTTIVRLHSTTRTPLVDTTPILCPVNNDGQ